MTKREVVQLRCTDSQKAAWKERARASGMSLSAWIVHRLESADRTEAVLYPPETVAPLQPDPPPRVRTHQFKPDFKKGMR